MDIALICVPAAIIGARLYFVLFSWELYRDDPVSALFIWEGGMAIYGGVIGGVIAGLLYARHKKINPWRTGDLVAPCLALGQAIGRWGNFVNQEAFGTATGSDWFGMTSEAVANELGEGVLAHPCFLYESLWCLLGALVLHLISKKRVFSGQIILSYCVWYGFERGFIELLRTDSLYMFGVIRVSSLLSFVICIGAAIALIVIYRKRKIDAENNAEYVSMFAENEKAEEIEQVETEE